MTVFFQWTSAPLWAQGPPIWALALTAALAAVLALTLGKKRRRKQNAKPSKTSGASLDAPVTDAPAQTAPIAAANLQGVGQREEQQDAFRISPLSDYPARGLLCTLCDGMGGMAAGGEIARRTVAEIASRFPMDAERLSDVPAMLSALSGEIYRDYRGTGGATLVLAYLLEDRLWFWCVGDSDLFLYREGRLYAMNRRHEYQDDLLEQALMDGRGTAAGALCDPQAEALSSYIGCEAPACDYTRTPYTLQGGDALLLCSDGVSDTLSLSEIAQSLSLPPEACCAALEEKIMAKQKDAQDNYSAIVIRLHGAGA